MGISTHILDTSRGRPAQGVAVALLKDDGFGLRLVKEGVTDGDGRVKGLVEGEPPIGMYALRFAVGAYYNGLGQEAFYPEIEVRFMVRSGAEHYHVPLLLNPFGYSTYRGS